MEQPERLPLDPAQADAIAEALLAEGRARQHARLLQRWDARQRAAAMARAAPLALLVTALAWTIARLCGYSPGVAVLAPIWALACVLARRRFLPRRKAVAVVEG